MKILHISNTRLIALVGGPVEIGQDKTVDIDLPEGVIIDSFSVSGKVSKCEKLDAIEDQYMLELEIDDLPDEKKIILTAYITYKLREKINESIFSNPNFDQIVATVEENCIDINDYLTTSEFIKAQINGEDFN